MISAAFLSREEDSNLRPTGYELRPGCGFGSAEGFYTLFAGSRNTIWNALLHWFCPVRTPYGAQLGSEEDDKKVLGVWGTANMLTILVLS